MHHCLNSAELRQLIDFRTINLPIEDEDLLGFVNASEDWQLELNALTYLFSRVMHQIAKEGKDCLGLISHFYEMEERILFHIEECDFYFVDFILRNTRRKDLSIEEELVDFQNHFREHRYERTLRY